MASEAVVLAILVINEALAFLPGAPPPSLGGLLAVFCEALGENGGAGAEGLMGESRAILTTCRIVRNPIYMRLPRAVDFVAVCLPFVGGGGGEGEGGGGELGYSDLLEGLVGLVFDKVKPREGDREGGLEENVLYARVLGVLCGDLGVRSLFLGLVEEKDVFEIVASATAQVSPEKSQVFFFFFFFGFFFLTLNNRQMNPYYLSYTNYCNISRHKEGKDPQVKIYY